MLSTTSPRSAAATATAAVVSAGNTNPGSVASGLRQDAAKTVAHLTYSAPFGNKIGNTSAFHGRSFAISYARE